MSLVFKPKIADYFHFGSGKPTKAKPKAPKKVHPSTALKREGRLAEKWTEERKAKLVALRVLGVSNKQCGELLGRSADSCAKAIESYGLIYEIKEKREALIQGALK